MKHNFTIIIFLFFSISLLGQNLVPNSDFEKYNRRPAAMLDDGIEFTRTVPGWLSPNRASSDFITSRFRSSKVEVIPPHSGENMVGVVVQGAHWAEYTSAKLKQPLEVGKKYYVEFWISAPPFYNKINTGTPLLNDHFGILFDKRLYFTNTKIIEKRPQIIAAPNERLEPKVWKKINGTFTATQAATHIYVGQFLNKNNPENILECYFFIDDVFVEKLEKEAEQFEPSKTYKIKGKVASIVMENIYFETDKYDLLPESYVELNKLVKIMKGNPTMTINIQGHTDSDGNAEYNLTLSENRANSVQNYLVQQGITKSRLTHEGRGLSQPIAENSTSEGRQKNRRVEFVTKSQDTIGQGVILTDVAYPFSKNTLGNPIQLTTIGKNENLWDCSKIPEVDFKMSKDYQSQIQTFDQYQPRDARKHILSQTQNSKIVHIQSSPIYAEQQLFILNMLGEWYRQGYTHIGLEGLQKMETLNQLGYPTLENGKKFQQPIYGEIIRQGKLAGFTFFNLTPTDSEIQKAIAILKKQKFDSSKQNKKEAAKEWATAMNINRILKKNPNVKVLLCTNSINGKSSSFSINTNNWLKKFTGINTLNIGQSPTHYSCAKAQPPLLRKMKIVNPTIFLKRNTVLTPAVTHLPKESPMATLYVFHPKRNYANNRPTFLSKDGIRRPYNLNIDKFKMNYPCLVLAYKKGEDINKAIPIDVIELTDNQDVTPLILPNGKYEIVLRDKSKRKKMEIEVN